MAERLTCLCGQTFHPLSKHEKKRKLCRRCLEALKHVERRGTVRHRTPIEQLQYMIVRTGRAVDKMKDDCLPYQRGYWPIVRRDVLRARSALYHAQLDFRVAITFLKKYGREFWRMDEFRAQVRDLVGTLPKSANIEAENDWVYGSLQEDSPDFSSAPSIGACNTWIMCHTHVDMEKKFLEMLWRMRQPQAKSKQSQFEADRVDVVRQEDDKKDDELMKRLFPASGSAGQDNGRGQEDDDDRP